MICLKKQTNKKRNNFRFFLMLVDNFMNVSMNVCVIVCVCAYTDATQPVSSNRLISSLIRPLRPLPLKSFANGPPTPRCRGKNSAKTNSAATHSFLSLSDPFRLSFPFPISPVSVFFLSFFLSFLYS